jgi:dUTP pyrophosphatase
MTDFLSFMPKLLVKKCSDIENLKYGPGDAGIDLRASGTFMINLDGEYVEMQADCYEIKPGERIVVKTGIAVHIPQGFWGNIRDRSGLAMKHGLHNLGGVIDENYRGEIGIIVLNTSSKPYTIMKNERVAQMIITPYILPEIEYVHDLDSTTRGSKGFGDSGKI